MNYFPKPLLPMTKKRLENGPLRRADSTTPLVLAAHLLDAALIYSLLMIRIRNKT